jgi:hypothetical protein
MLEKGSVTQSGAESNYTFQKALLPYKVWGGGGYVAESALRERDYVMSIQNLFSDNGSVGFVKVKNPLILTRIEPRFLAFRAHYLVTTDYDIALLLWINKAD